MKGNKEERRNYIYLVKGREVKKQKGRKSRKNKETK